MKKNIVVIIDGTGCTAIKGRDRELSNAFRLAAAIETDISPDDCTVQIIHYFSGPASRPLPFRIFSAAFGQETKAIVSEAYLSLVNTFDSEDNCDIYLFGFSRGAVAVKVLAEIVCQIGILRKESCSLLKHVWKRYHQDDHPEGMLLVDQLKTTPIRFIGVFDPVHGPVTPLLDVVPGSYIPDNVEYAVEICALDETRIAFDPTFWTDQKIPSRLISIAPEFTQTKQSRIQHIWMPGGHSDIGSASSKSVLADLAFLTMIERVANCTSIPLRISTIYDVLRRINSRSDAFRVKSNHFPLFGKNRIVSRSQNSEMHCVFDLIRNQRIFTPRKANLYHPKAQFDDDQNDLPRYLMDIDLISNLIPLGTTDLITASLTRNLGDV